MVSADHLVSAPPPPSAITLILPYQVIFRAEWGFNPSGECYVSFDLRFESLCCTQHQGVSTLWSRPTRSSYLEGFAK